MQKCHSTLRLIIHEKEMKEMVINVKWKRKKSEKGKSKKKAKIKKLEKRIDPVEF